MVFDRKVIDGHYHIEHWARSDGKDFFYSTKEYEDSLKLHSVNLCSIPLPRANGPTSGADINIMAMLYKLKNPNTYIHGGIAYKNMPATDLPEGFDPLTQYQDMIAMGFDGIKLLETKTNTAKELGTTMDSDLYAPFFEAAAKDGTHVLFHVADPLPMWDEGRPYGDGTFPSQEELFRQVLTVLERNPLLKVTYAHFFFMSETPQRLEELFAKYPNMCVDLTPGAEMYGSFGRNRDYYLDFFNKYADRLLFGTDSTDWFGLGVNLHAAGNVYTFLTTDEDMHFWEQHCKGLKLSDEVLDKILWQNFERRVSPTPKPITAEQIKAYTAKYRPLITDMDRLAKIDEILATL